MPYCSTAFLADRGQEEFFYALAAMAKERKYKAASLAGAIFWNSPPTMAQELINHFQDWSQFHSLGIVEKELTSPTRAIANILAKTVKQLDYLTGSAEKINHALDAVAFSVSIGADLFLEIAKLKALRFLWRQIAKAYDPNYSSPIFIHAEVKAMENQAYQPPRKHDPGHYRIPERNSWWLRRPYRSTLRGPH